MLVLHIGSRTVDIGRLRSSSCAGETVSGSTEPLRHDAQMRRATPSGASCCSNHEVDSVDSSAPCCWQVGADGGEAALAAWPEGGPAPEAAFTAIATYLQGQGPPEPDARRLKGVEFYHHCCDNHDDLRAGIQLSCRLRAKQESPDESESTITGALTMRGAPACGIKQGSSRSWQRPSA